MKTRLIVADGQHVVRMGIARLLELQAPDITIVSEVSNGATLTDAVAALKPHVVLLDINTPQLQAVETVRQITELPEGPRVLVFTADDSADCATNLIAAGAVGYLLKNERPETVVQAIRAVAQGQTWFSQPIAGRLLRSTFAPADEAGHPPAPELTAREWEILERIGLGMSNSEIAEQLGLSKATVQNYVSALYAKLGITTRAQAVIYALRHNLSVSREVGSVAS
ncbi:MAG: response regulator transcription factor [Chloroflexaceae bacterium]|jgi:DNA-binding NarL/FixJ family response regulator|nr:response regulator transcription factor [Chloroflexaceae bacterium]